MADTTPREAAERILRAAEFIYGMQDDVWYTTGPVRTVKVRGEWATLDVPLSSLPALLNPVSLEDIIQKVRDMQHDEMPTDYEAGIAAGLAAVLNMLMDMRPKGGS